MKIIAYYTGLLPELGRMPGGYQTIRLLHEGRKVVKLQIHDNFHPSPPRATISLKEWQRLLAARNKWDGEPRLKQIPEAAIKKAASKYAKYRRASR